MEPVISHPNDRTIRIGNHLARYWAEGSQGSPVIMIHGLGGYVENWWPSIITLAEKHRVYAVDLPGFGHSEKPQNGPYHLNGFVHFISEFMNALGLDSANLIGHSMGGSIALQFTLSFPHKVDRLVLVSSAGLGQEVGFSLRLVSLPLFGELLTRPSLQASRSFAEGLIFDKTLVTEEEVKIDFEISRLPGAQQALLKTLRSLGSIRGQKHSFYGPILEKLPTITQPTLVVWGREDPVVPVKHAEAARRIPNARVIVFERCGHVPQWEHLQEFDQAVQEFFCD